MNKETYYWLLYSLLSSLENVFLIDDNIGDEFGALQAKLEQVIPDSFWYEKNYEHANFTEQFIFSEETKKWEEKQ